MSDTLKLSPQVKECLEKAEATAVSMGHVTLDTGHVLQAVSQTISKAFIVLASIGIQEYDIRIELKKQRPIIGQFVGKPEWEPELVEAMKKAELIAAEESCENVHPRHILVGILSVDNSEACRIITGMGYDPKIIISETMFSL